MGMFCVSRAECTWGLACCIGHVNKPAQCLAHLFGQPGQAEQGAKLAVRYVSIHSLHV